MTVRMIGAEAASFGHQGIPVRQNVEIPEALTHNAQLPLQATYQSPLIRWDSQTSVLVVQYRDPHTGEPERQYPAEWVVKQYGDHAAPAEEPARARPELPQEPVEPPPPLVGPKVVVATAPRVTQSVAKSNTPES